MVSFPLISQIFENQFRRWNNIVLTSSTFTTNIVNIFTTHIIVVYLLATIKLHLERSIDNV